MKTSVKLLIGFVVALFVGIGYSKADNHSTNSTEDQMYNTVSKSDLPFEVKDFLNNYFHYSKILEVEHNPLSDIYSISLSDGYDVEINSIGQWRKIEAPDGTFIPAKLLKKLLPHKSITYLKSIKVDSKVEDLRFDFGVGFTVDIDNGRDVRFTVGGDLRK